MGKVTHFCGSLYPFFQFWPYFHGKPFQGMVPGQPKFKADVLPVAADGFRAAAEFVGNLVGGHALQAKP